MKPIALAADHGGFELKEAVRKHLDEIGQAYTDFGTLDGASCDYPDMAAPACDAVVAGDCRCALLFCGTGDVAVLSAAKRMELLPFLTICSRIGGAINMAWLTFLASHFL